MQKFWFNRVFLRAVLGIILFLFLSTSAVAGKVLRIATSTSTHNSGLTDYLFPYFTKKYNYEIELKVVASGNALQMGRDGLVDVIMVHARSDEDAFMDSGFGLIRRDLMYNDFLIVGPPEDPARVQETSRATTSFEAIVKSGSLFVSRSDDSGTNKKELALWEQIGVEPYGDWYFESGRGMLATLKIAGKENAYTIIDRGTWLSHGKGTNLKVLLEGDPVLYNPYGVIVVKPREGAIIGTEGGKVFLEWITSDVSKKLIEAFKVGGKQLFFLIKN